MQDLIIDKSFHFSLSLLLITSSEQFYLLSCKHYSNNPVLLQLCKEINSISGCWMLSSLRLLSFAWKQKDTSKQEMVISSAWAPHHEATSTHWAGACEQKSISFWCLKAEVVAGIISTGKAFVRFPLQQVPNTDEIQENYWPSWLSHQHMHQSAPLC